MKRLVLISMAATLTACVNTQVERVEPDRVVFSNIISNLDLTEAKSIAATHCAQQGKVAQHVPDGVPDGRIVVTCE